MFLLGKKKKKKGVAVDYNSTVVSEPPGNNPLLSGVLRKDAACSLLHSPNAEIRCMGWTPQIHDKRWLYHLLKPVLGGCPSWNGSVCLFSAALLSLNFH